MSRIPAVAVKVSMSDFTSRSHNYFELFGLAPVYALDQQQLEQHYRDIQQRVHPDRHVQAGDNERRLAAQWTSLANEGFQTLKHPLRRAQYLLQLQHVTANSRALSSTFLVEQMEWRESLQAAKAQRHEHNLNQLHFVVQQRMAALDSQLQDLFDNKADYVAAAGLVQQGQFLEKLTAEITATLDEFMDSVS